MIPRLLRWLLLVGGLLLVTSMLAPAQVRAAPSPGALHRQSSAAEAEQLLALISPVGQFELTRTEHDGYVFSLTKDGQGLGFLEIRYGDGAGDSRPRLRSAHYQMLVWNSTLDFEVLQPLIRAANVVAEADGGALPELPTNGQDRPLDDMKTATGMVVAAGILAGIWRRGNMRLDLRKPHIIQACVHSSIFLYWSVYWEAVHHQFPMIVLMIIMAYGADAAFSFGRFGSWRVGLGPLPVVFSTNLFVWLDWKGATLAMIGAFAFKTFVQRDGKHIINPSVAGLTLNAICTVLFPGLVHFGGLFHTLNVPPNMAEWVFLGSLIPLAMFRLVPVSIGTILGLLYVANTAGSLRPTLLLMMTLLATDPATTPKTDIGRVLFGFVVGVSYPIYSKLLASLGQPDDFAKILSVPLANIFVLQFDAGARFITRKTTHFWERFSPSLGATAPRWEALVARWNPLPTSVLVGIWVLLFVIPLFGEKPRDFEPALHWNWATPQVVLDADGVARCASNPVFCTPFSFIAEVQMWLANPPAR